MDSGVAPPSARLALFSHRVAAARPPKVFSAIRVISATRTTRSEAAASRLRLSLINLWAVLSGVCRIPKMTFFGTSRYSTMSSTTRAPTPARMTSTFFADEVSLDTNDLKITARFGRAARRREFFTVLRERLTGMASSCLIQNNSRTRVSQLSDDSFRGPPWLSARRLPRWRGGSRGPQEPPEGQADAFPPDAGLTGHAVHVVALAGSPHHHEGAVSKLEVVPRPVRFPPGLDDEAPGSAKRHDGHHRVGPQLRLVIGVEPNAVLPAPVAVDEDVIEQHAGLRAHACEETLRRRRERPRLERLPRIPVAELPGPGDQAGLEDAPPEEHDLPLLPRQLVAERPQCLVGLRERQPAGVVVEPGA